MWQRPEQGLVQQLVAQPAVVVGVAAAAVISIIYSWVVWRTAPDREAGPQVVDS